MGEYSVMNTLRSHMIVHDGKMLVKRMHILPVLGLLRLGYT